MKEGESQGKSYNIERQREKKSLERKKNMKVIAFEIQELKAATA